MADAPDVPPGFDSIADALYALVPEAFVAARNARADEAKSADRALAKRIRALHRPTLAAWAANLLVRHHRDLVTQLLDVGHDLRDAQVHLAGDRLRALTDQRRQLVRALTEQARRDAAAAGHPLGTDAVADLDRTLSAALADPDAARALAQGRLHTALEPPLWPGATAGAPENGGNEAQSADVPAGTEAGPAPRTAASRPRPAAQRRPAQNSAGPRTPAEPPHRREPAADPAHGDLDRARARTRERELTAARAAVTAAEKAERKTAGQADTAEQELRAARAARQNAQDEADQAGADLLRARERNDQAQDSLARTDGRVRTAEHAVASARAQASRAHDALTQAAERLRYLEESGPSGRSG
ncbi:hypothetical protein [Kitasatospora sp. NPDC001547]|uniref:hypothetical protein n=1 Tax=Kitasatospora sp. NPDC001547 TaxID=3364015 RepID=UPI003692BF2C